MMPMLVRALGVTLLFGLGACSPGTEQESTAAAGPQNPPAAASGDAAEQGTRTAAPSWRQDRLAMGRETYLQACAVCHEDETTGAPITARREDWSNRSDMWQAVLAGHANAGYLDMPGKGGQPALSDQAVEAATEYMMGLTFPERPAD